MSLKQSVVLYNIYDVDNLHYTSIRSLQYRINISKLYSSESYA